MALTGPIAWLAFFLVLAVGFLILVAINKASVGWAYGMKVGWGQAAKHTGIWIILYIAMYIISLALLFIFALLNVGV